MTGAAPRIDLRPDHWAIVRDILRRHAPGRKVLAFGSRATWTAKPYSDLDLAIRGEEPLSRDALAALREAFTESDLPFRVDLLVWDDLPESFRRRIEADHVVLAEAGGNGRSAPKGWPTRPLAELAEIRLSSVDKKTIPGERSVRLCNYTDVYYNNFIRPDMSFMRATATEREIENCVLQMDDVVITKDSEKHDDIGIPALIRQPVDNLVCGYHLAILRAFDHIHGPYLFYALSEKNVQQQFHKYANGVTRFGLRKADIGLVNVPTPPLAEQRAIARVLGALDDRIELNRRMSETLEAMAQALFKSWFVDFDPVRAKMEGRDPGLPPTLAALFPNRLVPSELGEIPEGWEVSEIGKEVDVVGGGTPSTKVPAYWAAGQHHWATPKDLSKLPSPVLLDTDRKITDAGVQNISSGLLPVGAVLLSSRAPIGYLAIAAVPVAVNQGFIAMICDKYLSNMHIISWCSQKIDYIKNMAGGTTFAEINKRTFRQIPMIVPDRGVESAYRKTVRPLYEAIIANTRQSRALAATRDALSPKLVSGEIRAREVGEAIEAAT